MQEFAASNIYIANTDIYDIVVQPNSLYGKPFQSDLHYIKLIVLQCTKCRVFISG